MMAFGRIPDRPSEFSATMIIGAMARINEIRPILACSLADLAPMIIWARPPSGALAARRDVGGRAENDLASARRGRPQPSLRGGRWASKADATACARRPGHRSARLARSHPAAQEDRDEAVGEVERFGPPGTAQWIGGQETGTVRRL